MMKKNLLDTVKGKISEDLLILPTLPKVVLSIQKAVKDPDIDLAGVAKIISKDPAISARIIQKSNTTLYHGISDNLTIQDAVLRIGIKDIKSMVLAIAIEQLFFSNNNVISEYLSKNWNISTQVASHAGTIVELVTKKDSLVKFNMETAVFMGLIASVGILPVVSELNNEKLSENDLTTTIKPLNKSCTKIVLEYWGFKGAFIKQVIDSFSEKALQNERFNYAQLLYVSKVLANSPSESRLKELSEQLKLKYDIELQEIISSEQYKETFNVKLSEIQD